MINMPNYGIFKFPGTQLPNLKFTVEADGKVRFPDGVPFLLQADLPTIIDTIRDNRGFPPIKRIHHGCQAPQWS